MTASVPWVLGFDEPIPDDADGADLLGGKGMSLRQIRQAGLEVPPGFVITTAACREYFRRDRRLPDEFWDDVRRALTQLEESVGKQFGKTPDALLLAVRSGAAVSMPGMMDTLLDCGLTAAMVKHPEGAAQGPALANYLCALARSRHGVVLGGEDDDAVDANCWSDVLSEYERQCGESYPATEWEVLQQAIETIFDSCHSDRAKQFREKNRLDGDIGTAVTIQAMFATDYAGVLFTTDPRDPASKQILLEAVGGRGDSLVSGEQTPTRWMVNRDSLEVTNREDGAAIERDEFQSNYLHTLCGTALQLESLFGVPLDIEWGCGNGRAVFFQARPIPAATSTEELRQGEIARLQQLAGRERRVWIQHNLGESLPAPTPLTWSMVQRFMGADGAYGRLYRRLGFVPSSTARSIGFLELIAGRIYADHDRLTEMFCAGYPFRYDIDQLCENPAEINQPPSLLQPDESDPLLIWHLPRALWIVGRSARRVRRLSPTAAERFEQTVLPPFLSYVEKERARRFEELSSEELKTLLIESVRVNEEFGAESLLPGTLGLFALNSVERQLRTVLGRDAAARFMRDFVAKWVDRSTSLAESLAESVQDEATLETLLAEFGHRGANEMELAAPRWRECPEELQQLIDQTCFAGPSGENHQSDQPANFRAVLEPILSEAGASCLTAELAASLQIARRLLPYRERGRHFLMMSWELIRRVADDIGRRTGLDDGVYYLSLDEVASVDDAEKWRTLVTERRARWNGLRRLSLPAVIDSNRLHELGRDPEFEFDQRCEFRATSLTAGRASGRVTLVNAQDSSQPHCAGRIVVCSALEPGSFARFPQAAAIVVEQGGLLSHGAVVARQLGIPVVLLPDARRLLTHDQRVVIDADGSRVLIERGAT